MLGGEVHFPPADTDASNRADVHTKISSLMSFSMRFLFDGIRIDLGALLLVFFHSVSADLDTLA